MSCYNCKTTKTPMWRRTLDISTESVVTLCNACGLYYKSKKVHRPTVLVSKKKSLSTSELIDKLVQESNKDKIILKNINNLNIIHCANCQNINTSIWRKDNLGRNICNACGLYFKKKGVHRNVSNIPSPATNNQVFIEIDDNLIRFNRIKRRKRSSSSKSNTSITTLETATTTTIETQSQSQSQPQSIEKIESVSPLTRSSSVSDSSPSPRSPLTKPILTPLIPDNYKLERKYSIGSIDQYHFDYSSIPKAQDIPKQNRNSIILPPISYLLNKI